MNKSTIDIADILALNAKTIADQKVQIELLQSQINTAYNIASDWRKSPDLDKNGSNLARAMVTYLGIYTEEVERRAA